MLSVTKRNPSRASGPAAGGAWWRPRWSAPAWGAVGVVALFLALSCWWVAVDRSVPYNDAAIHLFYVFRYRDILAQGHVLKVLELPNYYPPVTYLLGALGTFVGGVHVAAPIL